MTVRTNVSKMDEVINTQKQEMRQETVSFWSSIALREVKFAHSGNSQAFFVPEFYVEEGQRVCITGQSGKGKTSVLNLLAGEIEPQTGQFLVDNRPSKARPSIAYVSQEAELFNDSLRSNLSLGKNIPEEKLWKLLKDAGLDSWVRGLKDGLDTQVGERGLRLSAGQKERINFIRCLLLNRDIYFLDEVTAHLDSESEKRIIDMVEKYLKGKTLIIVSHKDRIRANCDSEYHFEGNILKKIY